MVYKLLALLFKNSDKHSLDNINKTIITITGKYGERGYSFTSDDYQEYALHLTDQYYPCHAKNKNCTNISQFLRVQGRYSDDRTLTLWTSTDLHDLIKEFISFITPIEYKIMSCYGWDNICNLMERNINMGFTMYPKLLRQLDSKPKSQNISCNDHYDKLYNGNVLYDITDHTDKQLEEWINKHTKLPHFIDKSCINEIKSMPEDEFIEKYGIYKSIIPLKIKKNVINIDNKKEIENYIKKNIGNNLIPKIYKPTTQNMNRKSGINKAIDNELNYDYGRCKKNEIMIICYNDEDYYHIVGKRDTKVLPKSTNDVVKKTPYIIDGDTVYYSKLKERYTKKNTNHGYKNDQNDDFIEDASNSLPKNYYWKTPHNVLIYHNENKKHYYSTDILRPEIDSDSDDDDLDNNSAKEFITNNIKPSINQSLRTGLSEINKAYKKYCEQNEKEPLKRLVLKEILTDMGFKKGTQINGKRGYNIEINNFI